MQSIWFIVLALLMGAMLSIYLPMNSAVSRHIGSVLTANLTFFFIALVTSFIMFLIWGRTETLATIKKVPTWLYITGVISALNILGTTYLIPRLGVRRFFILVIGGQILTAMVVSHFGWLTSPKDPISAAKIIGAALVILGAAFSTF